MNWVGRATVEVRTACSEKCFQSPVPTAKPMTTKPTITTSLVVVRTFCTLAVRPTPRQFRMVNAAINADAVSLSGAEVQGESAAADHYGRVGLLEGGKEITEVIGKCQCGGGDGGGEAGEEGYPAGHESPLGTVGVGEVDILAARTGEIDAEFGISEGAGECEEGAGGPTGEDQLRAPQIARHEAGGGENSRAHHVGNDQGSGAEEADLPKQAGTRDRRGR